jgi:hypothetical protein
MLYSAIFFLQKKIAEYNIQYNTFFEIIWKNIVEPERPQMTLWRMRIVGWITQATYPLRIVIFTAFPLQRWLKERGST